jgi:hypothetical protein
VKRSAFKRKEPDPQAQIKEAHREYKKRSRLLGGRGRSRTGAIGSYHEGQWVPSQGQLGAYKMLQAMERKGVIKDLVHEEVITFKLFNEFGQVKTEQINIDYVFFHNGINKSCRWDWKPPRVVHTKQGRKYPRKIHADWFKRFELLQFCQPDHDYRILDKESYEWIDL